MAEKKDCDGVRFLLPEKAKSHEVWTSIAPFRAAKALKYAIFSLNRIGKHSFGYGDTKTHKSALP
jgi:hypothetical protein